MITFRYPQSTIIIRAFAATAFVIVGLLFCFAGFVTVITRPSVIAMIPGAIGFAAGLGATIFAIAQFVSYPSITIEDNRFRIQTAFYQSTWFYFEEITTIDFLHLPLFRIERLVVNIPLLPWVFFWPMFAGSSSSMAFLITSQLHKHEDLLNLLRQKRPELFELSS